MINIYVAGIVSDNLKAQVQAINPRATTSFQYASDNPQDKSIMWISCICHVIALSINAFFQEDPFSQMLEDFKTIVAVLRRKPIRQFIKSTCIAPSNTRWNVIFLQMIWIIKHTDEIIALMHCPDKNIKVYTDPIKETINKVLLEVIPGLAFPLHYVAAAVTEAQSDSFQAAYTYSLIPTLKSQITEAVNIITSETKESSCRPAVLQHCTEASKSLTNAISFMFTKHAHTSLLQLMYTLTPEGRSDFRRSFPAAVAKNDPPTATIGKRGINPMQQNKSTIINYINSLDQIKARLNSEADEEAPIFDSTEELNCSTDEYSSDDDSEISRTTELGEANDGHEIDDDDPTALLTNTLTEYLILNHEQADVDKAVQCLLNWLMLSTDDLTVTPLIKTSALQVWRYLSAKKEWKTLADFALRCLSLVASESGVERLFSQHKHVVDYLRRRTSKELRVARLIFKLRE